ncbi:HU family DNA-binding protein [Defluviitoga tunisiensis]|uniref:Bacterial nucleoid DNA-binding protein n=1 Tax=Defluviitoga tunisiensis TaxID=1006576 RepID=A0A0C7P3R9_DEFTU|nr:HU family DNA-binding protein [Defluviitoga tunisiensis]CEP78960.1 bacterial nucleoid DNA-binding protein [Defluviitoga tunisiensis]
MDEQKRVCRSFIEKKTGTPKKLIEQIVAVYSETVIEEDVKSNLVSLRNFGTFKPVEFKPQKGVNPQTLEEIHIPAKRTLKF